MADKTINDLTDLGTTPASGDFFAIWDLDAAAQKKVSYSDFFGATITGGGTIATGGYTFTIPATGTAALATGISGGQTIYGGTAASENLTLSSTSNATKGNVIVDGSFRAGYDTNKTSYFGRVAIGYNSVNDRASVSHIDQNTSAAAALQQGATGWTSINAASGQSVYLQVNGTALATLSTAMPLRVTGDSVRIDTSQSPAAGGTGVQGEIAWDANYLYVCTATNTWKRVALTGGY